MSENSNQGTRLRSREERKLEQLARAHPDATDLAARVTSSSESIGELFTSEYNPETELGDPEPQQSII